ncbi:MAG: TPM domain-containing protein [Erysipelotrichaceae bacterium]|jgi:uncharacterized membrane protein YgcG|nr:TPM domain-containing protein [Erysipelotrichaceae bacterium]
MKHRKILTITLTLILQLGLWLLPIQSASYSAKVNDNANVFSSSQIKQMEQAIAEIDSSYQSDIRVITENTLSKSSLESMVDSIVNSTPALQAPNGGMKSSLILFIVIVKDQQVGVYYGSSWKSALDFEVDSILDDFMIPEFQSGDYANGILRGINEVGHVLDLKLYPEKTPQPATDWSWLLWVFIAVFVGFVIVEIFVLFFGSKRKKAQESEKKESERQNALRFRDGATAILDPYSKPEFAVVTQAKIKKYGELDPEKKTQLESLYEKFQASYEKATTAMYSAVSASGSLDDKNLSVEVYKQAGLRYESILEDAKAAKGYMDEFDAIVDQIDNEVSTLKERVNTIQTKTIGEIESMIDDAKADGYMTEDYTDIVEDVKKKCTNELTIVSLREMEKALQSVRLNLTDIKKNKEYLIQQIPLVEASLTSALSNLPHVKVLFNDLVKEYAPACYEAICGNGSSAADKLGEAQEYFNSSLASNSAQHYQESIDYLNLASEKLTESVNLSDAISSLHSNLADAKKRAPEEFRLAQADITKAEEALLTYQDDINASEYSDDIAQTKADLASAQSEYASALPDINLVIELALKANHGADKILEDCLSEREATIRLRNQARELMKKAKSDVDTVSRYVENHSSAISSRTMNALSMATSYLNQAIATSELPAQLDSRSKLLQQSISAAATAYDYAKLDVSNSQRTTQTSYVPVFFPSNTTYYSPNKKTPVKSSGSSFPSFNTGKSSSSIFGSSSGKSVVSGSSKGFSSASSASKGTSFSGRSASFGSSRSSRSGSSRGW